MHERLAVALAREIVAGRMAEGSVFPTGDQLTRTHGVSRTVARETLQALATAGLVRVAHGKRTIVNGIAEWRFLDLLLQRAMQSERLPEKLMRDLYEARLTIEVETARRCAIHASDGTIQTLKVLVASARDQVDHVVHGGRDPSALTDFIELDRAFHGTIGDGSGNVVLARIARDAHRGLLTSWHLIAIEPGRVDAILEQHRAIAQEIGRRNPDGAAEAMRRHVNWSLEDSLRELEQADVAPTPADAR
jgi:DNA-binding FadR family transcriptional regulator